MKNPAKLLHIESLLKVLFLSGILILGFFNLANAQNGSTKETTEEEASYVEIKLLEGTNIIGILVAETTEKITIQNEALGEVDILKSKIDSYNVLPDGSFKDGVYWHSTVNSSRNIFTPTGYGLKKGEGYYQNFLVFINQVSYGVTDKFSIGVGFEFASLLARLNDGGGEGDDGVTLPAFMLTPKFSIPIKEDKWNIGVGGLYLNIPYLDFNLGVLYGVSTWGSRDHNLTVGVGFGGAKIDGFGDDDGFKLGKRPVITLSGTTRFSKRIAMVSENWFFSSGDNDNLIYNSLGIRYLGNRVSVDLSIVGLGDADFYAVSPMPMIGVTIPFGTGWGR